MNKTEVTPYLNECYESLNFLRTNKRERIKSIIQSYSNAEYEWAEYNHPKPDIENWVNMIMEEMYGQTEIRIHEENE